ncbi:Uu.00g078890.m01.CDS01 [Anthostomella pinea]|uniref:Uu.00g078890.m01.CDS01 n=1 Tax=Anthostomella pinea TaxID=933095 RepID=A0AAI8VKS7_9PEZI|nr:Uu.00g078890.m01.CDS01 [Anthostomella pinea]
MITQDEVQGKEFAFEYPYGSEVIRVTRCSLFPDFRTTESPWTALFKIDKHWTKELEHLQRGCTSISRRELMDNASIVQNADYKRASANSSGYLGKSDRTSNPRPANPFDSPSRVGRSSQTGGPSRAGMGYDPYPHPSLRPYAKFSYTQHTQQAAHQPQPIQLEPAPQFPPSPRWHPVSPRGSHIPMSLGYARIPTHGLPIFPPTGPIPPAQARRRTSPTPSRNDGRETPSGPGRPSSATSTNDSMPNWVLWRDVDHEDYRDEREIKSEPP